MNKAILTYNNKQNPIDAEICALLAASIINELLEAEYKIWHAHPVWFIAGNPIVGYSKQKYGIRLKFWSGADFEENALHTRGEKFKDASIFYTNPTDVNAHELKTWLNKA